MTLDCVSAGGTAVKGHFFFIAYVSLTAQRAAFLLQI